MVEYKALSLEPAREHPEVDEDTPALKRLQSAEAATVEGTKNTKGRSSGWVGE